MAGTLFGVSLTLYIATLAPSVVAIFDDSLEFQLVAYQLGIAHPTGYPLYTLLGKLFTFIPIGNVAYRVNLMSAVFGAAGVTLTYLLTLQVAPPAEVQIAIWTPKTTGEFPTWPTHIGGLVGALLLAMGPIFWGQSTIAEVYTLNAFFMLALLLLVTFLPAFNVNTDLYILAFLAGLSLTHHRTMILLFPALALYLLLTFKSSQLFRFKTLLLSPVFFLLPFLLYLYLPVRGHIGSLDGTYQNNWAGFWRQVSASGYGVFVFDNPFGQERAPEFYFNLLADQVYTTVLGFIGLIYLLLFGQRKPLLLTGGAFVTYLTFNIFYNVSDIEVFFIPNVVIWAVWSGVGATFLLYAAAGVKLAKVRRSMGIGDDEHPTPLQSEEGGWRGVEVVEENPSQLARDATKYHYIKIFLITANLAVFALIIMQLFRGSFALISQSYTWQVHDYGLDMLQQPLPADRPAIVGILGEMTLLRYFQQTENQRPDIETVTADLETDRLIAVEKLLAEGKFVYLTRPLPGASERWSLSATGPLIRVNPQPQTSAPEFSNPANQAVTPEITLLGYNVARPPHTGPGPAPVRLTLFWQANESISTDLKVSARLLTPGGETLAVTDAVPVHFAYPATAWRPGEIIADVYDLSLPVDTPPGQYTPLIIWYDPAQNAAEVGRVELRPVTIK
jgi:hypothetical protein